MMIIAFLLFIAAIVVSDAGDTSQKLFHLPILFALVGIVGLAKKADKPMYSRGGNIPPQPGTRPPRREEAVSSYPSERPQPPPTRVLAEGEQPNKLASDCELPTREIEAIQNENEKLRLLLTDIAPFSHRLPPELAARINEMTREEACP